MKRLFFLLLPCLFLFSSCMDIIDDLTVNRDGSGVLKLNINLSKSKMRINSILALDSLNGKRVPTISEISDKIDYYADKLREKQGIRNVEVSRDFENYIFKFEIGFNKVENLEKDIKEIVSEENSSWVNFDFDWVKWDNGVLQRNNIRIPEDQFNRLKYEDQEKLKDGVYTSITRFQDPIVEYSNPLSKLTPNRLNLMIRTSTNNLAKDTQQLQNTIKVEEK